MYIIIHYAKELSLAERALDLWQHKGGYVRVW